MIWPGRVLSLWDNVALIPGCGGVWKSELLKKTSCKRQTGRLFGSYTMVELRARCLRAWRLIKWLLEAPSSPLVAAGYSAANSGRLGLSYPGLEAWGCCSVFSPEGRKHPHDVHVSRRSPCLQAGNAEWPQEPQAGIQTQHPSGFLP